MTGSHLPLTAEVGAGTMSVGGCGVEDLVGEYGTPLQVIDVADIDRRAIEYRNALDSLARPARAVYATKALPIIAVLARMGERGLGADVTTGGELAFAVAAGIDPSRIVQHGNARSVEEFRDAANQNVGIVVLDGSQDVEHLDTVACRPIDVLLRITPGIPAVTHLSMATAHHGQKFGVTLDEAPELFRAIAATKHLVLRGLHFHIGSQVTALEPFADAVRRVAELGSFEVLDAGGGLGVPFTADMEVPEIAGHVRALDDAMTAAGFDPATELIVEPGRALVARAVITVYRVRTVKHTAGTTFVAVDGGTSDDIDAVLGLRTPAPFALAVGSPEAATLVGMHCDSGDVLAEDVALPPLKPGALVVMPGTGAYTFSLASNYNCALRPAVIEVANGQSRVVVRREVIADLLGRQTL